MEEEKCGLWLLDEADQVRAEFNPSGGEPQGLKFTLNETEQIIGYYIVSEKQQTVKD